MDECLYPNNHVAYSADSDRFQYTIHSFWSKSDARAAGIDFTFDIADGKSKIQSVCFDVMWSWLAKRVYT